MDNIFTTKDKNLQDALIQLEESYSIKTLFVIEDEKIIGTVTDGDIRRALIKGAESTILVSELMNTSFIYMIQGQYEPEKIELIRRKKIKMVPKLNKDGELIEMLNFNKKKSILPIHGILMAGGLGSRLMPLTKDTPKPLLKVGDKPIVEYNLNLLNNYGIGNVHLTVKYLAKKIIDYYGNGSALGMNMQYYTESSPLGTIGAIKQIKDIKEEYILIMNSDILTNINLERMFITMKNENAEMIVATTDYKVKIPYGVLETENKEVVALKEKPTYTYYSNAGIYIIKKSVLSHIPENSFFNATDLMEELINEKKRISHFPINGYWLDVGKHEDFARAQEEIVNIEF